MKENCPVCGSPDLGRLAERARVPVLQNALYTIREHAVAAGTGELAMRSCRKCGFVWNAAFDPTIITYSDSYENCQTFSPSFRAHIQDRIERIAEKMSSARAVTIVEVGCGQGDFLSGLVERFGSKVSAAFGFDPAWRGVEGDGPAGTKVYRREFNAESVRRLSITPDIIVCRHTIEHIADPVDFLASVRAAITPYHPATLFLETPCNRWIQEHGAVYDMFYEHCSIFDAGSLARALQSTGFTPSRIERVFGKQYLWSEAETAGIDSSEPFLDREIAFAKHWERTIRKARERGSVAVWGAGAKGVTFLSIIDPHSDLVDCVVDVNPTKQGKFLPGTGHPIVSPERAAIRDVQTIIIMNPNYSGEILKQAESLEWLPAHFTVE
jgi:SAM-dependent methyltransferase